MHSCILQVIQGTCSVVGVQHVVDVGAGQGHLSRLLSFGYKLRVTTVEADGCHLPKAEKYDKLADLPYNFYEVIYWKNMLVSMDSY